MRLERSLKGVVTLVGFVFNLYFTDLHLRAPLPLLLLNASAMKPGNGFGGPLNV